MTLRITTRLLACTLCAVLSAARPYCLATQASGWGPNPQRTSTLFLADGAIVIQDRLDLGPTQTLEVVQPSGDSTCRILVRGQGKPARIAGRLRASGQIELCCDAGLVLEPTGVIQAQALKITAAGRGLEFKLIFKDPSGFGLPSRFYRVLDH